MATNANLPGEQLANIPAANGTYPIDVHQNGNLQIDLGAPLGGTQLTGTITFRAKSPNAITLQAISPVNSIDIAAPVPFTIEGNVVGTLEAVVSGFTGTANEIQIALSDFS